MTESLKDLALRLQDVSDVYAKRTDVMRDADWHILKMQEELGELVAEHLRLNGGKRMKKSRGETEQALADETADLLAHVLLYALAHGIDIESALERKWFKYLDEPADPQVVNQ